MLVATLKLVPGGLHQRARQILAGLLRCAINENLSSRHGRAPGVPGCEGQSVKTPARVCSVTGNGMMFGAFTEIGGGGGEMTSEPFTSVTE